MFLECWETTRHINMKKNIDQNLRSCSGHSTGIKAAKESFINASGQLPNRPKTIPKTV